MSVEFSEDDCWCDDGIDEEDLEEAVGSCDRCGADYYPFEDDGRELCGECQWYLDNAGGSTNER